MLAALSGPNRSSMMSSIASGLFEPSALPAMNSLVLVLKAIFRGSLNSVEIKRYETMMGLGAGEGALHEVT